jgi:hypothetical protein
MKNYYFCFGFLAVSLALGGCREATYGSAEDDAKRIAEYDRQTVKVSEQLTIANRQLESGEEQRKRMDALLQRWEKQADRYDAILSRWEKQDTTSGR